MTAPWCVGAESQTQHLPPATTCGSGVMLGQPSLKSAHVHGFASRKRAGVCSSTTTYLRSQQILRQERCVMKAAPKLDSDGRYCSNGGHHCCHQVMQAVWLAQQAAPAHQVAVARRTGEEEQAARVSMQRIEEEHPVFAVMAGAQLKISGTQVTAKHCHCCALNHRSTCRHSSYCTIHALPVGKGGEGGGMRGGMFLATP